MAQKSKPTAIRLGITVPWSSRWFLKKDNKLFIEEDYVIREVIRKKILQSGIASIEIERTGEVVRITIRASRPGFIIGRGGKGIEELREKIIKTLEKLRKKIGVESKPVVNVNVEELKRTEVSAVAVSQQMAFDIEKRMPYRTVIKHHLELLRQNREVVGAKIKMSGRLNGAEISRTDWLSFGRMPLQNLRANIDYGEATSFNTYGTVGIKVWIYKGDIFKEKENK